MCADTRLTSIPFLLAIQTHRTAPPPPPPPPPPRTSVASASQPRAENHREKATQLQHETDRERERLVVSPTSTARAARQIFRPFPPAPASSMGPSRPLMRGLRPPRVFPTRGGRTSPYAVALTALLVASVFLLALIAFGVFSLPVSAPTATTGGEAESTDARPARPHVRRDLSEGLGERGAQWTEVISWEPRSFVYHNFLSKEECEYLIGLAKPHMVKSTVVDSTTGKSKDSRVRTSSGMFLQRGRDKVIRAIEKRIADYTFIPVEHGEGLQVLHYEVGQKYEPHFDYFLDEFNTKNGGQRMATLLMYLSDVEEGGETIFPDANVNSSSLPWYNELSECARRGLAVKPKMGDALLFWSMKPDATLDPLSLHGGCPVIKGNKWSSTKWMHVHEYKA